MKALTVRQPWATLIALGVKTIKTRSWRAPQALIGQRLAIHAGKALTYLDGDIYGDYIIATDDCDRARMQRLDESEIRGGLILPLGAIVATATLTECVLMVSEGGLSDVPLSKSANLIAIAGPACPVQPCLNWLSPHWLHHRVIDKDRSPRLYDQFPYGDFRPGRWAWMLDDIKPCDPVPAKGKQGVWEWLP